MDSLTRDHSDAIGAAVFDTLRAEDEPWLSQCFVELPGSERLLTDASSVVFGKAGYGKTALYYQVDARSRLAYGRPSRLLVEWRPLPVEADDTTDSGWVARQVRSSLLDACALALVHHLARYPQDYLGAPDWAQTRLIWFIHRFIEGTLAVRLGPLLQPDTPQDALLHHILQATPTTVLRDNADPRDVIKELISAVQAIGLQRVWVMVDGLEAWLETDEIQLRQSLKAFLNTLQLFEPGGLIFKLFVPAPLEATSSRTVGLTTRRVTPLRLEWDTPRLVRLVEARLRLALNRPVFTLADLCCVSGLQSWLEKVGATSPREWLDQVRPLVQYYLEQGGTKPLDTEQWNRIRLANPPRVHMDDAQQCVTVGGREILLDKLPGKTYDILRYLYEKGGVVSKAELYYKVYLGLNTVPRSPVDKEYRGPAEYANLMDNQILRLREVIEPDRDNPVLIRTVRGRGVQLMVRW